jgi:hypothetical protein
MAEDAHTYCLSCIVLFSLPPKAFWTAPPMLPSVVNCFPIEPCASRGPPIFCAVPPIAPLAFRHKVSIRALKVDLIAGDVPVNCLPMAPPWSKTEPAIPVVFSPTGGCGARVSNHGRPRTSLLDVRHRDRVLRPHGCRPTCQSLSWRFHRRLALLTMLAAVRGRRLWTYAEAPLSIVRREASPSMMNAGLS